MNRTDYEPSRSLSVRRQSRTSSGFTIVELLVVIVIIGILAAVTIVAYSGINKRAIDVSLQSDLTSASTKLKLYQVDNMAYPTLINSCPTPSAGNICLKSSPGNTYSYSVRQYCQSSDLQPNRNKHQWQCLRYNAQLFANRHCCGSRTGEPNIQ